MNWQAWWEARNPQERRLLSIGAAVVGLALVYGLLIDPALSGRRALQKELPNLRQEAAQLQALAAEAQDLQRRQPTAATPVTRDSVIASLAARGLNPQSVIVAGETVKVQLSGASFAGISGWLDQQRHDNGISVLEASIRAEGGPGLVEATLTLHQRLPGEGGGQ